MDIKKYNSHILKKFFLKNSPKIKKINCVCKNTTNIYNIAVSILKMGSINPRELGLFTSLFYAVITALLILSILLIKSFRTSGVLFIYFYSIFVTTFMLSRIIGSLFYKSPSKKIEPGKEPTVTFVFHAKMKKKQFTRQ